MLIELQTPRTSGKMYPADSSNWESTLLPHRGGLTTKTFMMEKALQDDSSGYKIFHVNLERYL